MMPRVSSFVRAIAVGGQGGLFVGAFGLVVAAGGAYLRRRAARAS